MRSFLSENHYKAKALFLLLLFPICFFGSILIGNVPISLKDSFSIIGSQIPILSSFFQNELIPKSYVTIIMDLRLPRVLLSFLAGAGLSVAGCVFQGILSNSMADPYILGVSSGASFGATMAMLLPAAGVFPVLGFRGGLAFVGAVLTLLFVFLLSNRKGRAQNMTLLLGGIAMNYFLSSMISLLMIFHKEKLENVYFWTLGSFRASRWQEVFLLGVAVPVIFFSIFFRSRELDMIMFSEKQASVMGVNVVRIKKSLLIQASLLTAIIVSLSGIIGFVGLLVPNMVRMITGARHKRLLPVSALAGGIFLMICDTIARSILPFTEISVGIITAIFGVPFFFWLLRKNRKKEVAG